MTIKRMDKWSARRLGFVLLTLFLTTDSMAEPATLTPEITPPQYSATDHAGVNLMSGTKRHRVEDLSIGDLSHSITSEGNSFYIAQDSFVGGMYLDIASEQVRGRQVSFHGSSDIFDDNGQSKKNSGATLKENSNGSYTYTSRNGTKVIIDPDIFAVPCATCGEGTVTKVTFPDGRVWKMHYQKKSSGPAHYRLSSVESSQGYKLFYEYVSNNTSSSHWGRTKAVIGVNAAVDKCNSVSACRQSEHNWPEAKYSWSGHLADFGLKPLTFKVTDSGGQVTRFKHGLVGTPSTINGKAYYLSVITEVIGPNSTGTPTEKYVYGRARDPQNTSKILKANRNESGIFKATIRGETWDYYYWAFAPPNPGQRGARGGRTEGPRNNFSVDGLLGTEFLPITPTAISDGSSPNIDTFLLTDDYNNHVYKVVYREGQSETYNYDDRGNVLTKITHPKPGSSLSPVTVEANYSSGCNNQKVCNKPNWVADAQGNRTDYVYHSPSGQVASITQPADAQGVRPQVRYRYEQRYARYYNSQGQMVRASDPVWVRVEERYCQTSQATASGCAKNGDEVVIEYRYGASSQPNNLNLTERLIHSDGEVRRACYQYDRYGNRIGEIAPTAGQTSCP